MFVAVYDDKHMVGGTEIGANFLRQLIRITYSIFIFGIYIRYMAVYNILL